MGTSIGLLGNLNHLCLLILSVRKQHSFYEFPITYIYIFLFIFQWCSTEELAYEVKFSHENIFGCDNFNNQMIFTVKYIR